MTGCLQKEPGEVYKVEKGCHRPARADVCREAGNEEDYGYEVAKAGLL